MLAQVLTFRNDLARIELWDHPSFVGLSILHKLVAAPYVSGSVQGREKGRKRQALAEWLVCVYRGVSLGRYYLVLLDAAYNLSHPKWYQREYWVSMFQV